MASTSPAGGLGVACYISPNAKGPNTVKSSCHDVSCARHLQTCFATRLRTGVHEHDATAHLLPSWLAGTKQT